jgi:hypothetical protein
MAADPPGISTGSDATRLGFWAAVLTVLVTAAFAGAGVTTPARSGPFCVSECVAYPYVDVARFIPGDYLWLVPGIMLVPIFVVLMACIHAYAAAPQRIYSRIALSFALVYAVVLAVDYFVQFAVVVPSLQAGETDGLTMLTQYNPHGLFIALESLGYFAMSVAFLFAAAAFSGGRVERAIRGLFVLGFTLTVAALIWLGILGHDFVAFEVIVLTINWTVLIAGGVLLSVLFRRRASVEVATRQIRIVLASDSGRRR